MALRKIAREIGVAPGLALSMAKVESQFDHKAVSPKGAIGVLQVMPHVARGNTTSRRKSCSIRT